MRLGVFLKSGRFLASRFYILGLFFVGLCLVLWGLDRLYPPQVPGQGGRQSLVVLARDGATLRAFPDRDHVWRQPISLEQVSPLYLETLIAYEDQYFYTHWGVNPLAIVRAAWQWLWHGRIVSGGSTLTMQVARIAEPIPRTLAGKLKQILRAMQLEWHYSKEEILTFYLNYVPMGGTLEGVEVASRAYLSKPAIRLTDAESALLTVIPQSPSRLRPDRHPKAAQKARDKVLLRMQPTWGEARVKDAMLETVYAFVPRDPMLAPLLAERLRQSALKTGSQPLRVLTTLDAQMQQSVETLMADRVHSLPPKVSMAALVLDNANLEVRAYAGSADFSDATRYSHMDMVRATRSPGSTLKPFLYGFALDEGLIHSESLLADAPQNFFGYQPGNFQQNFHGPVSVSEALVKSLNVPSVEVLERFDPVKFDAFLQRGGLKLKIPEKTQPNLSLILGGAGTSLENLVGAYSALARGGQAGVPRLTQDDPVISRYMMSPGAAFIVRDILESGGFNGRMLEQGAGARRGLAWKTGTSFGFRDAWALGVSDRFTYGVWVGRPDGAPNPGYFGANVAAPFLVDLFDAFDGQMQPTSRTPPDTVSQARICWPLGLLEKDLPKDLCHEARTAWLLNGTAPPTFSDRLRGGQARYTYYVDEKGFRTSPACSKGTPIEAARWPAVLEPWLQGSQRAKINLPAWREDCLFKRTPEAGLRIQGASAYEIIRAVKQEQMPKVRLNTRGANGRIYWLVNGEQKAQTMAGEVFEYRFPFKGSYDLTALDEQGRFDRIQIKVE